jgi:enamine deaminase RidA (YjgF/YER057c/UK114 family)
MSSRTTHARGAATVYVTPAGDDQAYLSAIVNAEGADVRQATRDAYGMVADILRDRQMQVVHERIFGSLKADTTVLTVRAEALDRHGLAADTPTTYVQGRPLWGEGLAGVSLMAVRPRQAGDVWTITDGAGRACGRGWRRCGATFLVLQNLHGRREDLETDNSHAAQADRMFDRAEQILRSQQTTYRNVTRTWIYLSNILGWYSDFNKVRTAKYSRFGLMPSPESTNGHPILLPASTGIEGDGASLAAATMDLLATILEPGSPIEVHQMSNPKQKDAFRYGSAFSRGASLRLPGATVISISGTAAIDERGVSVFPGDFRAQMLKTIDNIEALIASEGATLADLCDATVFLKRAEDVAVYRQVMAERGLEDLPGVPVVADVCRDELLFEMDGAAVLSSS